MTICGSRCAKAGEAVAVSSIAVRYGNTPAKKRIE
jgi:hypothetical protein